VFYNVYFRLHYYFPLPRFVKRKTRICAIGHDARRPNIRGMRPRGLHGSKAPLRESLVSEGEVARNPPPLCRTIKAKRIYSQYIRINTSQCLNWLRLSDWTAGDMKNHRIGAWDPQPEDRPMVLSYLVGAGGPGVCRYVNSKAWVGCTARRPRFLPEVDKHLLVDARPERHCLCWGLVSQWQASDWRFRSYEADEPDWNFSPRQPNAIRDKREVPRVSSMGDLPWVGTTKILKC
jgi:hypothetical protein